MLRLRVQRQAQQVLRTLARLVQRRVIVLLLVQRHHTAPLQKQLPLREQQLLQEQARHLTVLRRVQLHRVRDLDVAQDA